MDLTIKTRLGIGFGILLLILCAVGGYAVRQVRRDSSTITKLRDQDKAFALTANAIQIHMLNHRRYEKDFFLNPGDRKTRQGYLDKFHNESEMILKRIAELAQIASTMSGLPTETQSKIQDLPSKYEIYRKGFEDLADRLAVEDMSPQDANKAMLPFKESIHALEGDIAALRTVGQKALDESANQGTKEANMAADFVLVFVMAGALLAVVCAIYTARSISGAVGRVSVFAENVASGDLDAKASGNFFGEIEQLRLSLSRMVESLKAKIIEADAKSAEAVEESRRAHIATNEAIDAKAQAERAKAAGMIQAATQLEKVVEVVSSASEQLSAQVQQSSRGTVVQSQRVAETSTAMEEMNATVLEVARSASQAAESASNARGKALDGAKIVAEVVKGIGIVQSVSVSMKEDMEILGKQAEGIGQIMNVISDIADQTNLLALNAAIEAARAGDAGRGFAVVADEVRKLAEKTMTATKEVGEAISGIQKGTMKNLENVGHAVSSIEKATSLANQSGEALKEIVHFVEVSTDQVRNIATASEEQSASSEEINRSIEEISRVSTETSDGMRQSAQSVAELARQTQSLRSLIEKMKSGG